MEIKGMIVCPFCTNDRLDMISKLRYINHKGEEKVAFYLCEICSKTFEVPEDGRKETST